MAVKNEAEKTPQKVFIEVVKTLIAGVVLFFITSYYNEKKQEDKDIKQEIKDINKYIDADKKDNEHRDEKIEQHDARLDDLEGIRPRKRYRETEEDN